MEAEPWREITDRLCSILIFHNWRLRTNHLVLLQLHHYSSWILLNSESGVWLSAVLLLRLIIWGSGWKTADFVRPGPGSGLALEFPGSLSADQYRNVFFVGLKTSRQRTTVENYPARSQKPIVIESPVVVVEGLASPSAAALLFSACPAAWSPAGGASPPALPLGNKGNSLFSWLLHRIHRLEFQ